MPSADSMFAAQSKPNTPGPMTTIALQKKREQQDKVNNSVMKILSRLESYRDDPASYEAFSTMINNDPRLQGLMQQSSVIDPATFKQVYNPKLNEEYLKNKSDQAARNSEARFNISVGQDIKRKEIMAPYAQKERFAKWQEDQFLEQSSEMSGKLREAQTRDPMLNATRNNRGFLEPMKEQITPANVNNLADLKTLEAETKAENSYDTVMSQFNVASANVRFPSKEEASLQKAMQLSPIGVPSEQHRSNLTTALSDYHKFGNQEMKRRERISFYRILRGVDPRTGDGYRESNKDGSSNLAGKLIEDKDKLKALREEEIAKFIRGSKQFSRSGTEMSIYAMYLSTLRDPAILSAMKKNKDLAYLFLPAESEKEAKKDPFFGKSLWQKMTDTGNSGGTP